MEKFFESNGYFSKVQKGFKAETPGCLEHSFAMFEALLDAKSNQRQVVVSWLDLKNAYGSVRHNLVQFALEWYHVPSIIRALIFDYYEKICAQVRVKKSSTRFFFFDLGLFQGCVLSCTLFKCVFQLLLDLTGALAADNGYHFKEIPVVLHDQAFADDISILSATPALNQRTIDVVARFLAWFLMQPNPKKCICMAMKRFDPRYDSKYACYGDTVYCPFDPELTIAGERLKFIVNIAADPSSLQYDHFKELGRWISVDLKEDKIKSEIRRKLYADMDLVDSCGVNGCCKLFLYEHFVVSRLSWFFLVHDLSRFFVQEINKRVVSRLKSWVGLYRNADVGALFRQRKDFGLQLTSLEHHYMHLQVVKCSLLENSKDVDVRAIYEQRKARLSAFANRWSGPKELESLEPIVDHKLRFAGQTGTSGLGSSMTSDYIANPSTAERRAKATETLAIQHEEEFIRHASCLVRQGVWTHWENVTPFDFSWTNLIYGPGPRVISFVLNSSINSVRSPDMLKLWGYITSDVCALCKDEDKKVEVKCTVNHMLVGCKTSLDQGRYTWRHDSVLKNIENTLIKVIRVFNARKKQASFLELTRASFTSCFVRSGEERSGAKPKAERRGLLDGVNDWKIQADYKDCQAGFPPVIYSTSERPDIVIWSASARLVILLELTVPAEEGIVAAQLRKQARYQTLLDEIQSRTKWKAVLLTVEIGARGHNPWSARRAFQTLGLTSREANKLLKSLSVVAARCSLAIFQAHKESHWSPKDLVVIDTPPIERPVSHPVSAPAPAPAPLDDAADPAPDVLRRHGCLTLFHFTDSSNVESIRKHGLLSAASITKQEIASTMNSDELSRSLDNSYGLQDYVRLSFNANNPMRFVAVKEKRITRPVLVVIKLEVVCRSGVFSDCTKGRCYLPAT